MEKDSNSKSWARGKVNKHGKMTDQKDQKVRPFKMSRNSEKIVKLYREHPEVAEKKSSFRDLKNNLRKMF